MTETILHQQVLDNGLELVITDQSNRYYGDFHQIKIDVASYLPLVGSLLSDSGLTEREQLRAKNRFGDRLEAHQELKRMGVAGADVESVTRQMVEQFLQTSLPYMQSNAFPVRLLKKKLGEKPALQSIHG